MKLNRKLIRKMILKEMKLLNEGQIQYTDDAGKEKAANNIMDASVFFDEQRRTPSPDGVREKFCYEMMGLFGHLSACVRDGYDIDANFADVIIRKGERIKAILTENAEYLK